MQKKYTRTSDYMYRIDLAYPSRVEAGGLRKVWGWDLARDQREGRAMIFALEESGRIVDMRDVGGEAGVVCRDRMTLVELDDRLEPTGRRYERDMSTEGRVIESDGSLSGWDAAAIAAERKEVSV